MPNHIAALALFALTGAGALAPHSTTDAHVESIGARNFAQDFGELHQLTLAGALELVEWTNEKKYFSARNALYEAVLVYDPSNVPAMKALGYRRQDGQWVPGKRRDPIDSCKPQAREEFEVRRRDVVLRLCAEIDRLMEGVAATPATRRALRREHQRILLISPNSPELRARLGEVWDETEQRFVLGEAATARATRVATAARVEELRAALPPFKAVLPLPWAAKIEGVSFEHCRTGGGISLVSSLPSEEVESLLTQALLARELVRSELARGATLDDLRFVYVLAGPVEMRALLAAHPRVSPGDLAYHMDRPATWIVDDLVVHTAVRAARPALVANRSAIFAAQEALQIPDSHSWLSNGIGGVYCADVTGTRRGEFDLADLPSVAKELARLPADAHARTRWLRSARVLLQRSGVDILETAMFAYSTENVLVEHVVVASAISQFLLEARRDDLFELMDRVLNDEEPLPALEASLELSTEELVDVLVRWIDELEPLPPVEEPGAQKK